MPSAGHAVVSLRFSNTPKPLRSLIHRWFLGVILGLSIPTALCAASRQPFPASRFVSLALISQQNIQLSTVAALAAELVLLFLLLLRIKRRTQTDDFAEWQSELERLIADLSERLGRCPGEEANAEILRALQVIQKMSGAARALWFAVAKETAEIPQSFASPELQPSDRDLCSLQQLPWLLQQVRQGRSLVVPDLASLPAEASRDREYLEAKKIRSMVLGTSSSMGEGANALVLVNLESKSVWWTEDLANRLGVVGGLFSNALRRKRSQKELQDKREWLRMALEASMIALWELDVPTGRVRWSQKQNSLLGRDPVELEVSYQKFLELIPEEDREDLYRRTVALLEDASANDEIVTEWRFHEPGGGVRWLLFRGKVFRDANGKPLRLRGVNLDITELKEAKMELLQLTERLLQAQELERQKLARDLHDDIGQRLSLLIIELDRLKQELPVELQVQRESVTHALEQASGLASDIHGLSHQLHSSKLRHLGLPAAMKELCSQISRRHGIEVRLEMQAVPPSVSEERALCLYRVAQEALQNAVKHSGARHVDVYLFAQESVLQMRVCDDGCGFDLNHFQAGLGLASMKERLRMVGGRLELESAPGRGTEVVAQVAIERIPLHASAD